MMRHVTGLALIGGLLVMAIGEATASEANGFYLETRTCQVYTGPCFANAEVGLAGKNAVMAWSIEQGDQDGVDLSGLHVVMVVNSSKTLGFLGLAGGGKVRSLILVDDRADASQRQALISFAKRHSGEAGKNVVRVTSVPVKMHLDTSDLRGQLTAGNEVKLSTRKARPDDCICSNESAYYPPLAKVENFAPGVTLEGEFKGRGLGSRWSTPGDRRAYMATFRYGG